MKKPNVSPEEVNQREIDITLTNRQRNNDLQNSTQKTKDRRTHRNTTIQTKKSLKATAAVLSYQLP